MMLFFNDFVRKYSLKNKTTSNIKIQQILSSLYLIDVGIYLGDEPFITDVLIVNLHPTTGTHWVLYIKQNYFISFGCSPPQKLSRFTIKRKGHCFCSEYKIQGLYSY